MPATSSPSDRPLRIAAVPAAHLYVQNISSPQPSSGVPSGVTLLADPQPAGAPRGQWWPPVMLDPAWITANKNSFDVMHVHFGTESFSVPELQAAVDALRAVDRPLVYTVHDLTNPQLVDQSQHQRQLDVLIGAAAEVVTLTPGAAAEVRRRWNRDATVIAHPRLAGARAGSPASTPGEPVLRIGVQLRDLRPNIDAVLVLRTVLAAAALLRERRPQNGITVVVDLNERVRDEALRDELRMLVAGDTHAVLREHPRLSDAELLTSIEATDVQLLPYAHGTHSGWLELCWDAGVAVIVPDVGYFAEQHADSPDIASYERGSVESLCLALEKVTSLPTLSATGRAERRHQLREQRAALRAAEQPQIYQAQLAVYRRALAGFAA